MAFAFDIGRTLHGRFGAHVDDVFIDMVPMHMVQVAIMQIVHMAIMFDSLMAAICTMAVGMLGVVLFCAVGHRCSSNFFGGFAGTQSL